MDHRTCVLFPANADDKNECDGQHDLPGFPSNGTGGNGFDDNCNGLVDDGTAITMCMDNNLPIIVFDLMQEGNIEKVVLGEEIGTLVYGR